MSWTHCLSCPHVAGCAEADGCERMHAATKTIMTLDDMTKHLAKLRRAEGRRRFFILAWRSFYRAFFRSLGYCLPILITLEWFVRHHK